MRTRWMIALSLTMATGCVAQPGDSLDTDGEEPIAEAEDPILGTTTFTNCSVDQQNLLLESNRFVRITVNSPAFRQCVDTAMRTGITFNGATFGPYTYCNGDPYQSDTIDQRINRVLDAATKSANNLRMDCSSGSIDANAQTGQNDGVYHTNDETMQWNGPWLNDIITSLPNPTCDVAPGTPHCRWAPYPWPYPNLGGIALHEASHTHGYTHGANDQESAKSACGTSSVPGWHFQYDTVPYIIEACAREVGIESGTSTVCGANLTSSSCRADDLYLETAPHATTCQCISDPRLRSIRTTAGSVYAGHFGTFATDPSTGNILKYNGTPDSWTQIGGPGASFTVNDVALYGLTPDRSAVMLYNGSSWTQIGGAATAIYAGGNRLYAVNPSSGNILRYNGTPNSWTVVGGPGSMFAVTNDGTLYGLTQDRQHVMRYWENIFGSGWDTVGNAANAIIGGGRNLYATTPDSANLMEWNGSAWTWIGYSSVATRIVANDTTVYTGSGGTVQRYNGTPFVWDNVSRSAQNFWAGGHTMIVLRMNNGGLLQMLSP